jgi:hypothetical protein
MNDLGPYMATGKSADDIVNLLRHAIDLLPAGEESLVGQMKEVVGSFDNCSKMAWFSKKDCASNVMTLLIDKEMEPYVKIHSSTKNVDPYEYGNYSNVAYYSVCC